MNNEYQRKYNDLVQRLGHIEMVIDEIEYHIKSCRNTGLYLNGAQKPILWLDNEIANGILPVMLQYLKNQHDVVKKEIKRY
jgi:hypothetical protein